MQDETTDMHCYEAEYDTEMVVCAYWFSTLLWFLQ